MAKTKEKKDKKISSYSLCKRILGDYVKVHSKKVVFATMFMVAAAAATAGTALMLKPIIDDIFINHDEEMLAILPIAIVGIFMFKSFAVYRQSVLMKFIGQRVATDMQIDMYRHLLYSDVALFVDSSSGKFISKFTNDINLVRKNMTNVLVGVAKEIVTLIFLIGVMFYQSVELSILSLCILPLAIYPVHRLGRKMHKVSHATQEELGVFTSKLDDTFQGARIVKAYGNEEHEVSRARSVVEKIFQLYIKATKIESAASPIMETLSGVAIAVVVWYGGREVINGITTTGALFSFIAALMMAYKPMKSLSNINTMLQEGLAAVQRVYEVLDKKPAIKDSPEAKSLVVTKADVEFKNVVFSYNKDDDKAATINNISFLAPSGKRIAFVGASGGGKTTIMNLILRFYDTDEGKILLNGTDIKDITQASLRDNIAIVSQEATLFDNTVHENILYGKLDATEEEVIEAAVAAAAHDFIMEQPDGYQTMIGQNGVKLSGGQRQRIAIARAMLRNAPILLLDEATSSLDTVSEKQVQSALDKLMEGRTTIIIAHRLSTILSADIINVVENGKIVETGAHNELLSINGSYSKLYNKQYKAAA